MFKALPLTNPSCTVPGTSSDSLWPQFWAIRSLWARWNTAEEQPSTWQRWLLASGRRRALRKLARARESLKQGQPVRLGTMSAPCDLGTTLGWLRHLEVHPENRTEDGAAIVLLARQSEAIERVLLEPLAELDQHHALRVDLLLTWRDLCDLQGPGWKALRSLSELGVACRVGVPYRLRGSDQDSDLQHLFELAVDGGAYDLFVAATAKPRPGLARLKPSLKKPPRHWVDVFERLRLEHGLPTMQIGRG